MLRFSGFLLVLNNDIIPLAAHHAPGVTGAEDEAVEEVECLRRKYEKED